MGFDDTGHLTRRTFIGSAVGALGATVVAVLARPLEASALAQQFTQVNDDNNQTVIIGRSDADGPNTGGGIGVQGRSQNGIGVRGDSPSGIAVAGMTDTGTGVSGYSDSGVGVGGTAPAGTGVFGASKAGVGVRGNALDGRGGRFSGKKAQIRLDPSNAGTHPASGAAGDLFVDKRKRLWFCKGGTRWVRVA